MRAGRDFSIEYEGWQERGNFPSFLELRSSEMHLRIQSIEFFYVRITKYFRSLSSVLRKGYNQSDAKCTLGVGIFLIKL